jgi:hypothetical protein
MRLSAEKIQRAVSNVLNDPAYRRAAVAIQAEMRSLHGLDRAANLIEEAHESHTSVRTNGMAPETDGRAHLFAAKSPALR